ncbi:MAG: D-Ala-D-Ala carboxypeptidase family metallohydrolase [Prevotella sp.]|jgi:zinc D-Ala-D-Ala carboxypeptidase
MINTKQNLGLDLQQQLSPHFKLSEFVASGVALKHHIDNMPQNPAIVDNLLRLAQNVLEPLRCRFGIIRITSGYRCKQLNTLVHGSLSSQHMRGEAADIHISSEEVGMKMFRFIEEHCDFDQLLFEHTMNNGCCWLHVSYRQGSNRHDARPYYPTA